MSVDDLQALIVATLLIVVALIVDSILIAFVFVVNFVIARFVAVPIVDWLLNLLNFKLNLNDNLLAAFIAAIQMIGLGVRGISSRLRTKKALGEGQNYIM